MPRVRHGRPSLARQPSGITCSTGLPKDLMRSASKATPRDLSQPSSIVTASTSNSHSMPRVVAVPPVRRLVAGRGQVVRVDYGTVRAHPGGNQAATDAQGGLVPPAPHLRPARSRRTAMPTYAVSPSASAAASRTPIGRSGRIPCRAALPRTMSTGSVIRHPPGRAARVLGFCRTPAFRASRLPSGLGAVKGVSWAAGENSRRMHSRIRFRGGVPPLPRRGLSTLSVPGPAPPKQMQAPRMRPGRPARSGMAADRRRGTDLAADLIVMRAGLSGVHQFLVSRFVQIFGTRIVQSGMRVRTRPGIRSSATRRPPHLYGCWGPCGPPG